MGTKSILNLPDELLMEIFYYLSPEDLVDNVRKTCAHWSDITYTNALWRKVTFRPSCQMSDTDVLSYIENMPQLKYFFLNHERNVNVIIDTMREHCYDIKSFIIKSKSLTKKDSITDMLLTFENMECFDVVATGSQLSLDYARLYGMFHSRSSVNMLTNEGQFTNNFILNPNIGWFPDVATFLSVPLSKVHSVINKKRNEMKSLSVNCDVNADTFSLICTCKELRYLFVCDTQYDGPPISIVPLANLTNLETLQLVGFRDVFSEFSPLIFEGVIFSHLNKLEIIQGGILLEAILTPLLPVCPKLKHLNVQDNILTDQQLYNIHSCKHLEYLDVSNNYSLTDNFILNLAGSCPDLKFLDISFCPKISEDFVYMLHSCSKLETLRIEGKYYSGLSFKFIPALLPNLKEFYVKHFYNAALLNDLVWQMPKLRVLKCSRYPDECDYRPSE
jgi:Leucine-rich repeat (LRR) protein